jgi:hypothetical protein
MDDRSRQQVSPDYHALFPCLFLPLDEVGAEVFEHEARGAAQRRRSPPRRRNGRTNSSSIADHDAATARATT